MKSKPTLKRRDFLNLGAFAAFIPLTAPLIANKNQSSGIKEGRRVVTGVNSSGKSIIISDGFVPDNARFLSTKNSTSDLWIENQVPVDLNDNSDHFIGYSIKTEPPKVGLTARIVTWQPGFSYPMHRTNTLDILFIVSGRLELILDEGKTILAAGDSAIQRGTNHGWRVDGDQPCTVGVVLISAIETSGG